MDVSKLEILMLVDYFDVWGNEQDGFEVNDLKRIGMVTVDTTSPETIVADLQEIEYFNPDWPAEAYEVDMSGESIEISNAKSGYPLCRLEKDYTI